MNATAAIAINDDINIIVFLFKITFNLETNYIPKILKISKKIKLLWRHL
jgi:hypothetical protein